MRLVLVGRQLVIRIVHPAQQRLLLVGKRKCIANPPFNHIFGAQIGQFHVVAVDQLRCLGALRLVQRPVGNQAVLELCVQGGKAGEKKRRQ